MNLRRGQIKSRILRFYNWAGIWKRDGKWATRGFLSLAFVFDLHPDGVVQGLVVEVLQLVLVAAEVAVLVEAVVAHRTPQKIHHNVKT